jgi:hypothetical protein
LVVTKLKSTRPNAGLSMTQCSTAGAVVEGSEIHIVTPWADNLLECPRLTPAQARFVFGTVLDGKPAFTIAANQLTISNGERGNLVFQA